MFREQNNSYVPRQFNMNNDVNGFSAEQNFFNAVANQQQAKPVCVIDLGSRTIRAVAGCVNEKGKVDVLGMVETESAGVTRGLITEPEETAKALKVALDDLSLFSGTPVNDVFVSIPGTYTRRFTYNNASSRKNAEKEISIEEVWELLDEMRDLELQKGDKVLHFFPQRFFIDGNKVIDPLGKTGKKLEVELQIVTGNAEVANNIQQSMRKAGLHVAALIPGYMSAASANLSETEKHEGVAVLDMGASASHLVLFKDGLLKYSAVIPFGGNSITEDVKNGCLVPRNEAELLKIKSGVATAEAVKPNEIATIPGKNGESKEVSVKNLAQIIQARVEEILDMALLEIKNSGLEKEIRKGLVFTGGGAQLKRLDVMAQKHTGMAARIGYAVEHLSNGIDMETRNPANSTAIGMIIKGNEARKYLPRVSEKKLTNTAARALARSAKNKHQ